MAKFNMHRRSSIMDVDDMDALHSIVYNAFPNVDEQRPLFRVDRNDDGTSFLYIVSKDVPDMSEFVENYGWERSSYDKQITSKSYDKILDSIKTGDKFQFRIKLATMIHSRDKNTGKLKLIPLLTDDNKIKYLKEKLGESAFINGVQREDSSYENVMILNQGSEFIKNKHHSVNYALFQGTLTIGNADIFRNILINGIGRDKAFGFGLITIMPI